MKIDQRIPFKKFILWCDGGAHFDSHLFALYLSAFQVSNGKFFLLNYHIAGEGKCDLDRYFGYMVCAEKRYYFTGKDLIGSYFFLKLF